MSQYHRHLDHDYQAARRETNYALFGNTRGADTYTPRPNWGGASIAWKRMDRWWVKYALQAPVVRLGRHNQRKMDEAWLRYKEFEHDGY